MTLAQMQARFFELKGKLAVGQITEQDFKHALEQLRFQDPHGRWWMIGAQSGRWYYYDGARWLLGDPPDPGAPGLDGGAPIPVIPSTTQQSVQSPYYTPQPTGYTNPAANSAQTISVPYSYAPAQPATPQPPVGRTPGNGFSPKYVAPDTTPRTIHDVGTAYPAAMPPPAAKTPPGQAPSFTPQPNGQAPARPSLGAALHQELGKVRMPHMDMPHVQVPHLQRPNLQVPNLHVPPQFVPHAPAQLRKQQPYILMGAVVIGLVLVALLLFAVDILIPGKMVSHLFGLAGQASVRPTTVRQTAVPAVPQNVDNFLKVGDELAAKSQFEPAISAYQDAAKFAPNKADVYWHWARALSLTGRIGEAIAQAQKSTRLDPTSASAFAELTRALAWAGQNDDAIKAGESAIAQDAQNATAQAFLAEAYLRAGRNSDAQQAIDKALELDDLNPETHRVAGWVSILSGRKDDGVGEWNRVIELAPDIFLYHYEFGLVYANHLNDPAAAIPEFQKAIDLYPAYIPSYTALGRAYLGANQPGPAILQFQKALTLDPKSTDAFVGLGQAFQDQQKCPQAIPYFQKALELTKDLALATKGLEDCGALTKGSAPPIATTSAAIVPLATAIPQATAVTPVSGSQAQTKATSVASSASTGSHGKGMIYFPVFDGQYHVFAANPDGSDKHDVVDYGSAPAVNDDGSRMLFYSWISDQRGIHRVETNGANDNYISLRAEDTLPSWAPDGAKYVYAARAGQGGDINKRAFAVRVGSTENRPRQDPPAFIEQAQYPAWGPNGQIAFRDCGFPDDQCGIAIVNADGSGKKVLTNINSTAPAWSPDGTRILFMSNTAGNWDVWAVSVNGGSPERLTDDPANDGLPIYSPDGSKIAFVSKRDNKWGVWQMDPNGENETKLFDIDGEIAGNVPGISLAQPGQTWLEQRIAWR